MSTIQFPMTPAIAVDSHRDIDLLERRGVPLDGCIRTRRTRSVAEITGAYLRGVRMFVIGGVEDLADFRELPEVTVLVQLDFAGSFPRTRGADRGVAPHAAARTVGACRAVGIRVAGFTLDVSRGPAVVRGRRIRRTLALMRRLERRERLGFETLDLDFGDDDTADVDVVAARGLRTAVRGAAGRYRVVARRAA